MRASVSGEFPWHQPLPLPDQHKSLADYTGRQVAVGIRPDHLAEAGNGPLPTLEGRVTLTEMLGADQLVHIEVEAEPVLTGEILEVASDTDAAAVYTLEHEAEVHRVSIVARLSADTHVASGQITRIAVQPDRLHFFDLQTGATLH